MTEKQVLKLFEETGALLSGHFELRSKLHSDRYFQCANVLRYPRIAERLCRELGTEYLGCLPTTDITFESRHLGLKLPGEKERLLEHVTHAAEQMEKSVRLDEILSLAAESDKLSPLISVDPRWMMPKQDASKVRIGVAEDEAFCFYYRDNLRLLKNFGAEIIPFSPNTPGKSPSGVKP